MSPEQIGSPRERAKSTHAPHASRPQPLFTVSPGRDSGLKRPPPRLDYGVMWTSLASTLIAGLIAVGMPTGATMGTWVAPLEAGLSAVLQEFQRPADRFAPGHRGVDFSASPGTPVLAIGEGEVTHVGEVGGVPSITIDHGTVRSSYLPVDPSVEAGDHVAARQVIGKVGADSHCPVHCLHLGIRRPVWEAREASVDPYLDPVAWIQRIPVLKPFDR